MNQPQFKIAMRWRAVWCNSYPAQCRLMNDFHFAISAGVAVPFKMRFVRLTPSPKKEGRDAWRLMGLLIHATYSSRFSFRFFIKGLTSNNRFESAASHFLDIKRHFFGHFIHFGVFHDFFVHFIPVRFGLVDNE